jgi:hypothetical protein
MAPHPWVTEEIDGGPIGIGLFWICPVCGASGGPVFPGLNPWPPFIAGLGLQVSADCEEAQAEIRIYTEKKIEALQSKWQVGECQFYVDVFLNAFQMSSEKKNLVPLLTLLTKVDTSSRHRMPLKAVKKSLVGSGFG